MLKLRRDSTARCSAQQQPEGLPCKHQHATHPVLQAMLTSGFRRLKVSAWGQDESTTQQGVEQDCLFSLSDCATVRVSLTHSVCVRYTQQHQPHCSLSLTLIHQTAAILAVHESLHTGTDTHAMHSSRTIWHYTRCASTHQHERACL